MAMGSPRLAIDFDDYFLCIHRYKLPDSGIRLFCRVMGIMLR